MTFWKRQNYVNNEKMLPEGRGIQKNLLGSENVLYETVRISICQLYTYLNALNVQHQT